MRSVIVALALSSATALVAPSMTHKTTALQAATKDPATTAYQPTEGANAAVDTNNKGDAWVSQMQRPRRNRKSAGVRSMVRENFLTPANLMQPIFIHEDSDQVVPIPSMPGQSRHTLDSMVEQVKKGMALGATSASRRVETPSRHRRDSSPGMMEVGGFFLDFEAIRSPRRPAQVSSPSSSSRRCPTT